MDLAPHLDIDVKLLESNVRKMNAGIGVIPVSAKTGDGGCVPVLLLNNG
jgi:hydrogenase nickel incorporation protein HypB